MKTTRFLALPVLSALFGLAVATPAAPATVAAPVPTAQSSVASANADATGAAPIAEAGDPALRKRADALMNLTYRQFAAQRHVPPFDWSTDGCTPPTPSAWATVFRPACVMHDFGYRNYGGGLRLDPGEERRAWVDRRFLEEMRRVCADRPSEPGFDCAGAAQTMYTAVRSFGSTAWYGTPSRASGQQGPE